MELFKQNSRNCIIVFFSFQMVWHQLKEHIRRNVKPATKDEPVEGIKHFWMTMMTPELCRRYISHLKKVWPVVLAENGGATGY